MNAELPYEPFDENGKVVCQICGKSFQVISPTHLKTHKLQYADYIKRYPDAPLSSDQFVAKSKYGKNSTLFVDDAEISDDVMEEEVVVEEEIELQDEEFEMTLKKVVDEIKDPVQNQKMAILDHLRLHYANVEKDYRILHKSPITKKFLYDYITDFADPVLKIIFDFPETFWHNKDVNQDPLKFRKLKNDGWQVITINGSAPGPEDIDFVIDGM